MPPSQRGIISGDMIPYPPAMVSLQGMHMVRFGVLPRFRVSPNQRGIISGDMIPYPYPSQIYKKPYGCYYFQVIPYISCFCLTITDADRKFFPRPFPIPLSLLSRQIPCFFNRDSFKQLQKLRRYMLPGKHTSYRSSSRKHKAACNSL